MESARYEPRAGGQKREETEKQQQKREAAESASPYSISVGQVYDGPLDLLLDLIRKQDIDIYDIPIGGSRRSFWPMSRV